VLSRRRLKIRWFRRSEDGKIRLLVGPRRLVIQTPIKMATPIKDNINWRRHRAACPNYREDWMVEDALYRCICLAGTPPETHDEQDLCMKSRTCCWRLKSPIPLSESRTQPDSDSDYE
jgi:hypothetical protein